MRMTQQMRSLIRTTDMVEEAAKELRILAPTDRLVIVPPRDARVTGVWAAIVPAEGDPVAPQFLETGFDGTRSYVGATAKEAEAVMTAVYWTMRTVIRGITRTDTEGNHPS